MRVGWKGIGINSLWILIATFSLAFTQWVIMAVIARQDGPDALGAYALAQAFANPAGYLAWLNLRQQYVIGNLNYTSWTLLFIIRVVVPLIVFLPCVIGIAIIYSSPFILAISAGVFLLKHAEGLFDLSYGRLQHERKMKQLAYVSIVRSIISIPCFYFIYVAINDVQYAIIIFALMNYIFYIIQSFVLKMEVFPRHLHEVVSTNIHQIVKIVLRLAPFALSTVMMALTTSAPRLLLEGVVGTAELGRFAAVAHFIAVGSVIVGSVAQALAPAMASAWRTRARRTFLTLVALPAIAVQSACLICVLIAMVSGGKIIALIYGNNFVGGENLLAWAALAAGPVYASAFAGCGLYVTQKQIAIFVVQSAGVLTTCICTLYLASEINVIAGFIAIGIGGMIQTIAAFAYFGLAFLKRK